MKSQKAILREQGKKKLYLHPFEELIHDQPKEWLHKHFSKGARDYPVNVTSLIANIIWQTRARIIRKEREPLKELIRTFWYMHIKPTLARAESLSLKTDQYNQLVSVLADMVKKYHLLEYKELGFRDDNRSNRKTGINANIILYSEKVGHGDFLEEFHKKYDISIISLGGQPSIMNVEYFVDTLRATGINLQRSFYLFSIVDYDSSGWSIRDSFMKDLRHYGIKHIKNIDLVHPDMLLPDEVLHSRYPIRDIEETHKKNTKWLKEIKRYNYENQIYLGPEKDRKGKRVIYGLEAESISTKRLKMVMP